MLEIGLKTQWSCTPFLMLNKLTKKPQKTTPPKPNFADFFETKYFRSFTRIYFAST